MHIKEHLYKNTNINVPELISLQIYIYKLVKAKLSETEEICEDM